MSIEFSLYHSTPALALEACLPSGHITAILGPSGSGKSSVLRALAGLLQPQQQRIQVEQQLWSDSQQRYSLPTRQRSVGMVSQHYALFPHLTVLENVQMALLTHSSTERRQQAQQCLQLTHIAELAQRYPAQLSGGQKQRVALARAIARRPKLLLLDEPFSAVDHITRKHLYVELKHLHQQLGNSVLLVTHDVNEAAQLASQLCVLEQGRLLQTGPTAQVLAQPHTQQAARLLGMNNLFSGELSCNSQGKWSLRWGECVLRVLPPQRRSHLARWRGRYKPAMY